MGISMKGQWGGGGGGSSLHQSVYAYGPLNGNKPIIVGLDEISICAKMQCSTIKFDFRMSIPL